MKIQKMISLLTAFACCSMLLTGCAAQGSSPASESTAATETQATEEAAETAETMTVQENTELSETSATMPETDGTVLRVGGLKGPTTMGLVKLMDDAANGNAAADYSFTMVTAADELTALVASGKVDIALLPANVASILYQKTEGNLSVIDINTLGVLYLVSADTSVQSIEQLKGKTVYLPGKGTTPEYALRYLIAAAGLSDSDVTFEFKSEATEVASVLAEDPSAIGLLPQPFVTSALMQNDSLSIILDLTRAWDDSQDSESKGRLVTGVTIVNNDFLAAHQELVDTFLKEHEASIQFTGEDPETAAALIAEAGIVPKAEIARKALPYCNIAYFDGTLMQDYLSSYLEVLYEQDPSSVGGTLPDDAFYYEP